MPSTASKHPGEIYADLMQVIRIRLDLIKSIKQSAGDDFSRAETAAFHGRKVIEGIAFACLVATDNSLKAIPRDAKGQWNAESIFRSLRKKGFDTLPSPSFVRAPTAEERAANPPGLSKVYEGIPERRLSHDQLIDIYQSVHPWSHEINPYTQPDRQQFYVRHETKLWDDLEKLDRFLERHVISIAREGFFCVLRDSRDGMTKVSSISRPPGWTPPAAPSP